MIFVNYYCKRSLLLNVSSILCSFKPNILGREREPNLLLRALLEKSESADQENEIGLVFRESDRVG